jgi:hypothetical protein
MCTTRQWKQIEPSAIPVTSEESLIMVIARRSDGLIVKSAVKLKKSDNIHKTAMGFQTLIDRLETYRNCKCSELAPCQNHITNKQGENKNVK